MTPTRAGEGKTTTLVGLTQGLGAIGKRPVACLREPSLGPVFGVKGGAAGGGMTEVMAIMAVARDVHDLRERLGRITVAHSFDGGRPITAEDLGAAGAMTVLLKDAIKPNLIQTLEGQPCLMHCGPFANIAHGTNSLVADLIGMKLGDYVVTESGFGSDMGMEKFFDIVCRFGGLSSGAYRAEANEGFAKGGIGAADLASAVVDACDEPSEFRMLYEDDWTIEDKIEAVARRVYGASDVYFYPEAEKKIGQYSAEGLDHFPVCMAKTHLSLSADPQLLNAPENFSLPVRDIRAYTGAGWLVPLCGDIMQMPGLGKTPAALNVDIDDNGRTVGLF